jgi:hypothetical protein
MTDISFAESNLVGEARLLYHLRSISKQIRQSIETGDTSLRSHGLCQQDCLVSDPRPGIQPAAPGRQLQRLDDRAQQRLADGVGFQQSLDVEACIRHISQPEEKFPAVLGT